MTKSVQVLGIGNAIVDVLGHSDDAFIASHDIPKGGMILIGTPQAEAIYSGMTPIAEVSGGSAANTIACLASLGGSGGFIGKVADDALGHTFRNSMTDLGIVMDTSTLTDGTPTGRCLINVTPDAERSMATFIGAAEHVTEADIVSETISNADVTYFEGYLFEQETPRKAFVKACKLAKAAGKKTAITLSDAGCVDRNRAAFLSFITAHVDIVFANEDEAKALFEVSTAEEAATEMAKITPFAAITRSEKGSIVIGPDGNETVPAINPVRLEDTTGAGDAYAGGFLYGFTKGMALNQCAHLGSLSASEVISHMGPRPETPLVDLAKEAGLV